jgi:export-related chaperone CsaA
MKQILVYGDSLSWGIVPGTRRRLSFSQRWPGVLEAELGKTGLSVRVFENCLNGRRTTTPDPVRGGRNGLHGIEQVMEAHSPLDLVIVLLGTNDFQVSPAFGADDVAHGVVEMVNAMRGAALEPGMSAPPILVIAPPPVREPKGAMADKFRGAADRCHGLGPSLRAQCEQLGCLFLDAADVISVSAVDGVHIDAAEHAKLGHAVAGLLASTFAADEARQAGDGAPPPPSPSGPSMAPISWQDFTKVELRVGRVIQAEAFAQARKPAYKLHIDFGPDIGIRKSSAQITARYAPSDLVGRQVVAVVNFPPKQIGPLMSECLVTGFHDAQGQVTLCVPEHEVPLGTKLL